MKHTHDVATLVRELEEKISKAYDDPTLCNQYAWWTLETILNSPKTSLIAQQTIELTDDQLALLGEWLDKLVKKHMPIQYLIGSVPFNGVEILVKPPTLIPRPETEEWTIKLIEQLKSVDTTNLNILEIGTGTGCIALALATAFPDAQIFATDIADKALALANENATRNGIVNAIFVKADVYDGVPKNMKFDLIVSNPPYIAEKEWQTLDTSVTTWEDKQALIAEHEGYAIIEKIINEASQWLRQNKLLEKAGIPQLIIEIGFAQAAGTVDLMKQAGYTNITVHKDLEEKDRVVSGSIHVASVTQNTQ